VKNKIDEIVRDLQRLSAEPETASPELLIRARYLKDAATSLIEQARAALNRDDGGAADKLLQSARWKSDQLAVMLLEIENGSSQTAKGAA
jgi:hypothetical protein